MTTDSENRVEGTVKWFSARLGYGFITGDDGEDVFCHFSSIQSDGYKSLDPGDRVSFGIQNDEKDRGAKAAWVTVIE